MDSFCLSEKPCLIGMTYSTIEENTNSHPLGTTGDHTLFPWCRDHTCTVDTHREQSDTLTEREGNQEYKNITVQIFSCSYKTEE